MEEKNMNSVSAPTFNLGLWKWVSGTALVIAIFSLGFMFTQFSGANADYICTKIVEEDGPCANGTLSSWETVSTSGDASECTLKVVEKRVYTGTREIQHILSYLNRRPSCDSGYSQNQFGNTGGASGFHSGKTVTESTVCQIEEVKTLTGGAAGNDSDCNTPDIPEVDITKTEKDIETEEETTEISSKEELEEFRAMQIDGWIMAEPEVVNKGDKTLIKWQTVEATKCSITGTNGDSWDTIAGTKLSSSIQQETVFNLDCTAFNGSDIKDSVKVKVLPSYKEF